VLTPVVSGRFKKDVKRAQKRNKDMSKLTTVLACSSKSSPCQRPMTITR
jgi:mRNA-degrading endonuclease YafQ of YafQ-DinJ toxin-antitoxin module